MVSGTFVHFQPNTRKQNISTTKATRPNSKQNGKAKSNQNAQKMSAFISDFLD